MKKSTLSMLFILLIAFTHAQNQATQIDNADMAEQYRLKANRFNTAGYVFLGGGVILSVIGCATYADDFFSWDTNTHDAQKQEKASRTMVIIGAAVVVMSIPMFAIAHHAHKARLNIQNEKLSKNIPIKGSKSFTALALSIPLGRKH